MVTLILSRLLNGRIKARSKQLNQIASLLEMTSCETNYAPCNNTLKQSWCIFNIYFKLLLLTLFNFYLEHNLRSHFADVAVHTSNVIMPCPISMRSINSKEKKMILIYVNF